METAGDEEQDGMSVHSASSLPKEHSQVNLELKVLEALEIYPVSKLQGLHHHFVLYGMTEYMKKSLGKQFSSKEILELLDRFFNLEMVKPDEEEAEALNQEEDFSLPQHFFPKEEQ